MCICGVSPFRPFYDLLACVVCVYTLSELLYTETSVDLMNLSEMDVFLCQLDRIGRLFYGYLKSVLIRSLFGAAAFLSVQLCCKFVLQLFVEISGKNYGYETNL